MAFGPIERLCARHRNTIMLLAAASALVLLTGATSTPKPISSLRADSRSTHLAQNETRTTHWPQLSRTCALCHGFKGNPLNDHYPRLAGQPATYIAAQLRAFATGTRRNPPMTSLAMALSNDKIAQLAKYFARLRPTPYSGSARDHAEASRGESIVGRFQCAACHGESFSGQGSVPALAAQSASYLIGQLNAFKRGTRRDPSGEMNAIAAALSPHEIQEIVAYLAQLPEPAAKRK